MSDISLTSDGDEDITQVMRMLRRYAHSAHVGVSPGPELSTATKGGAALCNQHRSVHIKQRNTLNPGSF